jgi:hypothetical protein
VSQLKQVLGVLGLMVALAGVALGYQWLVWIAIALLGLSLALRIALNARSRRTESPEHGGRDEQD